MPKPRVRGRRRQVVAGVAWVFELTERGVTVRQKHCRRAGAKLYEFETLVGMRDLTFSVGARPATEEAVQPGQATFDFGGGS